MSDRYVTELSDEAQDAINAAVNETNRLREALASLTDDRDRLREELNDEKNATKAPYKWLEAQATIDRLQREVEEMRAKLDLIASFKGKTLIGEWHEAMCDHAYSTGAHQAFEECADIALSARPDAKEPT